MSAPPPGSIGRSPGNGSRSGGEGLGKMPPGWSSELRSGRPLVPPALLFVATWLKASATRNGRNHGLELTTRSMQGRCGVGPGSSLSGDDVGVDLLSMCNQCGVDVGPMCLRSDAHGADSWSIWGRAPQVPNTPLGRPSVGPAPGSNDMHICAFTTKPARNSTPQPVRARNRGRRNEATTTNSWAIWPNLIGPNVGEVGPSLGRVWSTLTGFGPTSAESGPNLAESGRQRLFEVVPRFGHICPENSADVGRRLPEFGESRPGFGGISALPPGCGPNRGRHRPALFFCLTPEKTEGRKRGGQEVVAQRGHR